ncbi:hypothetical protein QYF50_15430 [Paenibacillus vini]|uniref:hypothetical protein n=1 Tax=Paenibacillus vini TaxID=1476024 RepID=UPI0025B634FB|nr:hypothetical protein [Paenibacillus vini]MDN4069243.1 hypothetical protein [Paenibacillus vini]MDN4069296.1 hypothetical protein [Paenibacillus vini]
MTEQLNLSEKSRLTELAREYQEILNRQLNAALENNEMDRETYIYFISQDFPQDSRDSIFDHFGSIFNELAEYHRNRLQDRILKGAEMLDKMSRNDPRFPRYMEHYDNLVNKLKDSEKI